MCKTYISQPTHTNTFIFRELFFFNFSDLFNPLCYPFYYPVPLSIGICGCLGCGEAADHMITKKQWTSLSPFLCHIHGIVLYMLLVYYVGPMFICIREAHNGTKYVKTVIL